MEAVPERKLAAILSADVAGYSRLMERDEAGTLARLKIFRDTFAEKIRNHQGRVVSTAGDALLAEFASVVNAVDCAVRVQRDLFERNAALPDDRRMAFRIGINLGDVMVEGGDLFGEGVNIAARLQGLAEPGGILISGPVFEQVKNKLSLGFDYLGPQPVKNIAESVQAYRVLLGEAESQSETMRAAAAALPASHASAAGMPPVAGRATAAPKRTGRRSGRERLKRRAALAGVVIATLFAINMMTWSGYPWFMWPTLAIAAVFSLRSIWIGWSDET